MVPANLHDFLIVTAGASASFIGLLFVALSVVMDRTKEQMLSLRERALAEGSYGSLINVFFISIVGLVPSAGMGYVMLVMSFTSLAGVYSGYRQPGLHRSRWWIALSAFILLSEAIYGLYFIINGNNFVSPGFIMALVITLFATGLARAWELTGIRPER